MTLSGGGVELTVSPSLKGFGSKLQSELARAGAAKGTGLTTLEKNLTKPLDGVTSKFGSFSTKVDSALRNLGQRSKFTGSALNELGVTGGKTGELFKTGLAAGVGVAGAALTGFALKGIHDFTALAGSIRQFQIISGASAEDASRLVAAMEALGVDSAAAGKGVFFLEKNLTTTAPKLAALGISIERTNTGAFDLSATMLNVADAVAKTEDPARRAEIAFKAFGKGGSALLPILEQGREGLEKLFEEAGKHGEILSQSQVDSAFKFKLAMHELGEEAGKFGRNFGSAVVPILSSVASGLDTLLQKAESVSSFLDRNFFRPLGNDFNIATNAVNKWAEATAHLLHIPQDTGLLKKISQEFANQGAAAGLSAAQIRQMQIANGLIPIAASKAATATADQTEATDALAKAQANAAAEAKHLINANNALGRGITHVFGDTKHQVLDWQRQLTSSLNFVTNGLSSLASQSHLKSGDIVKAFDSQLGAMARYRSNFDTLLRRNAPADLVKELASLGEEGAPLVDKLANANATQFGRILRDWRHARDQAPKLSEDIRAAFIDKPPINIPVHIKTPTRTQIADARNAIRDQLEGGLPFTAKVDANLSSMSVDAATVNIFTGQPRYTHAAGGLAERGKLALFGEEGPEIGVPTQDYNILPADVSSHIMSMLSPRQSGGATASAPSDPRPWRELSAPSHVAGDMRGGGTTHVHNNYVTVNNQRPKDSGESVTRALKTMQILLQT